MTTEGDEHKSPASFNELLNYHFYLGTSPSGKPASPSGRWTVELLAKTLFIQESTVSYWRNGYALPTLKNFSRVLNLLFGPSYMDSPQARELIAAYNRTARQPVKLPDALAELDDGVVQQIPAAYQFGVRNGKIDTVSASPEPVDRDTAIDIYDELIEKLRRLVERLEHSNTDPHVRFCAQRLFDGLGTSFDSVRPGVMLSRMRAMESIRDAFNSAEGRESIFPNTIAMIDEVCLSGQDLLATFPIVRQIERERIALGIEKTPDIIDSIRAEAAAVQRAATDSEVVAPGALAALRDNDPELNNAVNTQQTAELLGDKLLVIRNFVSAALRSIVRKSALTTTDAWALVKPDFQEGARTAARMLPPLLVIGLVTHIAGPVAGLAGLLRSDIFKSIKNAVTKVEEAERKSKGGARARKRSL